MFDPKTVSLGIAPIGWCNDDMPELGAENTFQQTVSEMALAGFTGCEIGNKYPTDPAELKKALDLRGMRIASRWYSSFILTRSMEEEEKDFIANLDFLEAVGANHINVSEQSYSIQGKVDVPILTGGNMDIITMSSLIQNGLINRGRVFTFSVQLPDRPGELLQVASIVAKERGNIIKLEHNQFVNINRQHGVELRVTLEAFGHDHKNAILTAMAEAGYQVKEVATIL
mgnify:CR=1 FL=1